MRVKEGFSEKGDAKSTCVCCCKCFREFSGSPVVRTLGSLFTEDQVQPLVRELRSQKLLGVAKKNNASTGRDK